MLTRLEKAQQQWGGSHSLIDNWLAERQQLLVNYCKLAGMSPYDSNDHALPAKADIQAFCQILMDYVSAGHFEVYDSIVKDCERNGPEGLALAKALYPRISETTDTALDFNDQYAEVNEQDLLADFDTHLSRLGEALELRFELEDELIHNVYEKHT